MRSLILIIGATMLLASVLSLQTNPSSMPANKMLAQLVSATNINTKVLKFLATQTKHQCVMAQIKIMNKIRKIIKTIKKNIDELDWMLRFQKSWQGIREKQKSDIKDEEKRLKIQQKKYKEHEFIGKRCR
jgi:hypothetical protein